MGKISKLLMTLAVAGAVIPLTLLTPSESKAADPRAPQAIYEIFTRSFQDSNGDGVGDLNGVISRLDYLNNGTPNSLGVDALWLTPIFPSPSYHGYDTVNYEDVNQTYGNLDVLRRLISESHRRGIRVFLDMAVNHTSNIHPWFQSSASPSSPDRGLYLWSPEPLSWPDGIGAWHFLNNAYYYGTFGKDSGVMPDLNWKNPQVLSRIENVFAFWTRFGIDGYRLDAAKFLDKGPQGQANTPLTHRIWRDIVAAARAINPRVYFVGEVWDSAANIASYYGGGAELDSAFDFPVAQGLRDSVEHGQSTPFGQALVQRAMVEPSSTFTSPIINNHDMVRIASIVGQNRDKLKLAAVAQLTLPGTPTIYYGDEIGLPQGSGAEDLGKRTPMEWDGSTNHGFAPSGTAVWNGFSSNNSAISVAAQKGDPQSLLNVYRGLLQLRKRIPLLRYGTVAQIQQPQTGIVAYVITDPSRAVKDQIVVALNFSTQAFASIALPVTVNATPTAAGNLYGGSAASFLSQKGNTILIQIKPVLPTSANVFVLSE